MATQTGSPKVVFPEGFDTRWELELPSKGYIEDVVIELEDGKRYALCFVDPTRLRQELDMELGSGRPYYAAGNLVVLPEVNRVAIQQAAQGLVLEGCFERLQSLGEDRVPHRSEVAS